MEELAISGFGACAELPPGMWNLPGPGPGIEPMSPALAGGFLTTGSPGKFYSSFCLQAYGIQSRCYFPVHLSSFLPILFSVAMWLLYNRVTVGTFIPLGSLHSLVGFIWGYVVCHHGSKGQSLPHLHHPTHVYLPRLLPFSSYLFPTGDQSPYILLYLFCISFTNRQMQYVSSNSFLRAAI